MCSRSLRSNRSVGTRKSFGKRGCEAVFAVTETVDCLGLTEFGERSARRTVGKVKAEERRRSHKILRRHREELNRISREETLDHQESVRDGVDWDEEKYDRQSKCLSS